MTNSQSVLLFIPFLFALVLFVFRLDEKVSASKAAKEKPSPKFCPTDHGGKIVLTDPDGRQSDATRQAVNSAAGTGRPLPKARIRVGYWPEG